MIDIEPIIKTLSDEYGKSDESQWCDMERAVCFFSLGLRLEDVKLMKASIKTLSRYFRDVYEAEGSEEFYYTVPDSFRNKGSVMSFIKEIAEVPVIFDLMNGVIPMHRTELLKYLNPFVASATEWYDTYCFNIYDKRKKKARKSALTQFIEDVSLKFEDIIVAIDMCDDECFRRSVIEYLDSWLGDFLAILKKIPEAVRTALKPFGELLGLMEYDSALESSFNTALDMFLPYVVEYEEGVEEDKRQSLLDIAIRRENLSALERLLKTDGIPLGNIRRYPENNLCLLSLIFSHGLLLPGTKEGRRAYFRLLSERNPSPEILKAVDSPLYYKDSSPLAVAIPNIWFSPDKYPLLVKEKGNPENGGSWLSPLYFALSSGDENKVKAVIALGFDFSWHDVEGNNLLHYVIRTRPVDSYSEIFSLFPLSLLEERNNKGERPLDYLTESNTNH